MKFLYTDIDYVLSLSTETEYFNTKWGLIQKFNDKAVKIYTQILADTGALPIVTSDWRYHHSLQSLQEIFTEWAGITVAPVGLTPEIPGIVLERQAEWRAMEILAHVKEHKPDAWVAIDDLELSPWIDRKHFVRCASYNEGIKQSGKMHKTIQKLNA